VVKGVRRDERESGTGQDTPPPGHGGTLSRPVPLSRRWWQALTRLRLMLHQEAP
jgi:hypothetical protein